MGMKYFILDMDGTIYLGDRLFPDVLFFLERVRKVGGDYIFLTNNSSKSSRDYVEKLGRLGIEVGEERVLVSTHQAIEYLARVGLRKVYLVGTDILAEQLLDADFQLESASPECVLVGFDLTLTYAKLERACYFIQRGCPWFGTHPDKVCPTERGSIPDCGSICACIEAATGVPPARVFGKPSRGMAQMALERLGGSLEQTAVVGDRLYTDMEMALRCGLHGFLVLTGESTLEDWRGYPGRDRVRVWRNLGEIAESIL
ncbi:MAG: HAD-IIA family hydrolase [Planctomycetota bacterium]|nr:MAG: HAD-IIA family hydrolase [Planctomycetota bacterium]